VNGVIKDTISNIRTFRQIAKKLKVLARSQPEDKYMLVTGLKQIGSVVAVTGDGTNDAPALNKADVGFAMGKCGTAVAQNASDIVLTNDDFCAVITAIKYGRNIYDNVRKFLQFQLTVNVVAMFIVFAGALLLSEEPLTPVQMLWVNLIMDTFAALALATEPPSDALLERQPAKRTDKIVNNIMWRNIFGHSIYQIAVLLTILYAGPQYVDGYNAEDPFFVTKFWAENNPTLPLAQEALSTQVFDTPTGKCVLYTIVFQAFVMMQVFNLINARKLGEREFNIFSNFCNNWKFFAVFGIILYGQLMMVQYGGEIVRASPLTNEQ
jgi:P-type Ca2+ transporter type 2B